MSCTSIGPAARVLGGAAVGGLVAAAAAGPALADPQPAAAMSAMSAATVTGKLLFMS
jgi:hypothetical protein